MSTSDIKEAVKEKYGQAALRVQTGGSTCCGGRRAVEGECDPITSKLYAADQTKLSGRRSVVEIPRRWLN
jgi:arsenite methyltransferase